mmetsp:Transcript_20422/g.57477  ORF Transcript_20422/g.57477 Transcript_20422/m.57477 type:complete len:587 (+) Transcript_20422:86-1846(+)
MYADQRCRAALLILIGTCKTMLSIRLQTSEHNLFLYQTMQGLREKIRFRFAHVDTDGDGVVSFAELKRGFNHESVSAGEAILREMLAACAAGDREATSCTQEQMERTLFEWVGSRYAMTSLALLRADPQHGFRTVPTQEIEENGPCGPSADTPDGGLEGVKCTMQGAMCFTSDVLVAWSLNAVCQDRTCICEATPETKRLAKLGLMGAAGVSSAKNFSDPGDEVMMPSCGNNWSAFKVVGKIDDVDKTMTDSEGAHMRMALPHLSPASFEFLNVSRTLDTEVALYKSAHHRLSKNGAYGKVCMMSWQATRSLGDWQTNLMINEMPFRYAKPGTRVMAPKGLVLAYESTRSKLKSLFEQECCNSDFKADKVIISGHSHGGAMAELQAIDVVSNWECPTGRDLGAKELAVVMVAPHASMWADDVINQLWSCNDAKSCLPGSAITIVTHGDYVGDKSHDVLKLHAAKHPSEVAFLPCPPIPEGANYNNSLERYEDFWCHGMYNYIPLVEQKLVGEAGWGSSCDGACGEPNRMMQCNQWVIMGRTGCSYAEQEWLKPATECPASKWLPEEERCDCHFDLCTEITNHGCKT